MGVDVVVSYRREDEGFGGRLHDALASRLGPERVGRARNGGRAALVAVLGPDAGVFLQDPHDPVRLALEDALAAGTPVVPFLVGDAQLPRPTDLPPPLARLADLSPVEASDRYWDASVDAVERRVTATRGRKVLRAVTAHPVRSVLTALTAAGTIVGILATLHVFDGTPGESRKIEVAAADPASGVTRQAFMTDYARRGQARPAAPAPAGSGGFVFTVGIELDNAADSTYTITWRMLQPDGQPFPPFVDQLGDQFAPAEATGDHRIWVPCPPVDPARFRVEFSFGSLRSSARPPKIDTSGFVECRIVEPRR